MAKFTCPFCATSTRHPHDVRERYCPVCHVFVDLVAEAAAAVRCGDLPPEGLIRLAAGTGFTVDGIQRALGHAGGGSAC
jgi:hypothetical protein